jgi:hypothetical protein
MIYFLTAVGADRLAFLLSAAPPSLGARIGSAGGESSPLAVIDAPRSSRESPWSGLKGRGRTC